MRTSVRARQLNQFVKADDGQAIVLTTLALFCLMGFLGFAVDIGMLFRDKVNLQKVADAAAFSLTVLRYAA